MCIKSIEIAKYCNPIRQADTLDWGKSALVYCIGKGMCSLSVYQKLMCIQTDKYYKAKIDAT